MREAHSPKRLARSFAARQPLAKPNQEWAIDFASAVTAGGQRFRIFSVLDAFTRECLALEIDTSLPSRRITRSAALLSRAAS